MNHIYRIVWNQVSNAWVAVAESARGRGKGSSRKLVAAALSLTASFAQAAPVGGQVVSGAGNMVQSAHTTTITQSSQNLSLNWQSFNIAKQETVNFVQPSASAIAVNRIVDTNGSQILGHLNANGQVYLINPNGILFGQGAQVNVGSLVASTLDLNDASLSGNARLFSGNGTASIVNQGTIHAASGGYVALLGKQVSNQGSITAPLGTVALGAGNAVTLNFNGNSLVHMQIDQSLLNSLVENGGLIQADGGLVLMGAGAKDALLASVVNNTGKIEARTVENHQGTITLLGGMAAGTVNVGGTLDASAPNGGNGGLIETSAAQVNVADSARVTTLAAQGSAGTWLIDPVDYTVAASGGNMTGAAVATALAGGNFAIQSSSGTAGTAGTAGDINMNDAVAWSANTLTLNASANININAALTGTGTASLALQYGQGAVALSNTSNYNVSAVVTLPAGQNFSTQLGSNGTTKNYTVITSLGLAGSTTGTDLQGMAGSLAGNYALGADIDASGTASWNSNAGFAPVGSSSTPFTGVFSGLGHTLSGLRIARAATDYVGLFGLVSGTSSQLRDLNLSGGSITGKDYVGAVVGDLENGTLSNLNTSAAVSGANQVGGLAGVLTATAQLSGAVASGNVSASGGLAGGLVGFVSSGSAITGSHATGTVNAALSFVGGLVGKLDNGGSISNSSASGAVSAAADYAGGLVGQSTTGGSITNSSASGAVLSTANYVGGLTGEQGNGSASGNSASGSVSGVDYVGGYTGKATSGLGVTNGRATGAVNGHSYVGGLVGQATNGGITSNSSASGNVTATGNYVGGLVGQAMYGGSTINSSASGNVTATGNYVGGLVGQAINGSSTSNSSASGNVTATGTGNYVGGLIGQAYNSSGLSNSSASGNVNSSGNYVGGLIGQAFNSSSTSNSSASGTVSGNSSVGGLVGETDSGSAISNSGASGAVSGSTNVGGLVGLANGPVSRSYATAQVTSQGGIVGGLVGLMDGSTAVFTDVFASGDVTSSNAIAGGLAGKLDNGARLTRAYASGTVVSGTKGGLVGLVTSGLVTDGYFNSTANSGTGASNTSIGMTGLSNANAFTANNYSGFTFTSASADAGSTTDNRWVMVNADGSLVTSAGSTSASAVRPLLAGTWRTGIADAVGLQLMSLKLNDSYTLANNIDASATGRAVDGSGNAGVWGAAGFVPVGVNNTDMMSVSVVPFSGSLNGQYHRLSGLTVVTSYALAGLIGKLDTAGSVSAIGLIDASITGTGSTNIVDAGALVGFNLGSVRDSLATGTVRSSGSTSNIGGLVGYQMDPGSITSSMAAVNVSSTVATNGAWLGGLVGALDGSNTAITDSYATGTVSLVNSASGDAAGGLSGYSSGTISNSFATGAVNAAGTANGSYDALVGDQSGGTTTNSVASGWVKGAAVSGGTSGAAMQQAATFGGLNLDTTWKIYEGHTTPLLRNWLTPLTVTVNYTGPTATGPNSQQYNATTNYAGGVGTSYSLTTADSSLVQGNLAALSSKNVGAPTVGADLYSSQLGYLITPVLTGNTSVNVTAAPLQVSGLTAVGKTYDTNVVASITGTAAVTALGSDVVTLGGTAAGAFADKNVGIAKAVTVTGVALSGSGADNGNYNLVQQTGLTATISRADLAVTGLPASDKTDITNTTATLGGHSERGV